MQEMWFSLLQKLSLRFYCHAITVKNESDQ